MQLLECIICNPNVTSKLEMTTHHHLGGCMKPMNAKSLAASLILFTFTLVACTQNPETASERTNGAESAPVKARDFGTVSADVGRDVAANATGVYVVGETTGSLDGVNKGGRDGFIRKYDGGVIWAEQFGTREYDTATRVAADAAGNSYVVGQTLGALGSRVGQSDAYVRKYNSSGVVQWTRQFGTPSFDYGQDVAVDGGGNVLTLSQEAALGFTVRKFNSSGVLQTTRTVTNPGLPNLYPNAMAVDSAGNVLVLAGWVQAANQIRVFKLTNTLADVWNVAFQPSTTPSYGLDIATFGTDIYITAILSATTPGYGARYGKLNSAGTLTAVKQLEPTTACNCTYPNSITVDGNGDIYVAGRSNGAFPGFINAGLADIVVFKYNSANTRLWAKQLGQGNYGSTGEDFGYGIAVSDAVYITGESERNLLGDPKYGTSDYDAFLVQMDKTTGAVLGIDQ
jgi:Beta-propeller repeat